MAEGRPRGGAEGKGKAISLRGYEWIGKVCTVAFRSSAAEEYLPSIKEFLVPILGEAKREILVETGLSLNL